MAISNGPQLNGYINALNKLSPASFGNNWSKGNIWSSGFRAWPGFDVKKAGGKKGVDVLVTWSSYDSAPGAIVYQIIPIKDMERLPFRERAKVAMSDPEFSFAFSAPNSRTVTAISQAAIYSVIVIVSAKAMMSTMGPAL